MIKKKTIHEFYINVSARIDSIIFFYQNPYPTKKSPYSPDNAQCVSPEVESKSSFRIDKEN